MTMKEFYTWVYKELGIDLSAYKQQQLVRRIESLVNRSKAKNIEEYKNLLANDSEEKVKFLDFITINVTEFFRNQNLFDELEIILKGEIFKGDKRIKVWSAACSLGCEPYSIVMMFLENGYKNFKVIATDIDENILLKAKDAIYNHNEVKNMNPKYLKYFRIENKKYYLSNEVKGKVIFKKADLILDNYEDNFDLILCRNVVIYFNSNIKEKIYKKFSTALNKDGILFVGATESIYNPDAFSLRKSSTFIYRKK
ncbi:MAG: CheR family methyltransferase [Sarcina sp.]